MRTRRSPRNQDRLWKMLAGKPEPKPEPPKPMTAEEIDKMFWLKPAVREQMKKKLEART